jgi:hypothetical protein
MTLTLEEPSGSKAEATGKKRKERKRLVHVVGRRPSMFEDPEEEEEEEEPAVNPPSAKQ